MEHIPVLLKEVLEIIEPVDGGRYLDATFGAGGYSRAILSQANCRLVAIDRDPSVRKYAELLAKEFVGKFEFIEGRFSEIDMLTEGEFDGIVMDIGVSSMQLDQADRGFSFSKQARLDMRMGNNGISAYDIVNEMEEEDLANMIFTLGGERLSRRIAANITKSRPVETTTQLADIIKQAVGYYKDDIHPATRTFQAIRIYVNDELEELRDGLQKAKELLAGGGKLAVVSFHSLEDRIVKEYFAEIAGKKVAANKHMPFLAFGEEKADFSLVTKKPVIASDREILENPRSRSAKLRAVVKRT